jgi:hypothetical protein
VKTKVVETFRDSIKIPRDSGKDMKLHPKISLYT